MFLNTQSQKFYTILMALVVTGLLTSIVTAGKIVNMGIEFPFSNIIFSIFTYPIVDCICELWGKQIARQTVFIALACQLLAVVIFQLSIISPHPSFWHNQLAYATVLSVGWKVVLASIIAFLSSQLLDILIYQKIKNASKGKWLWLRSNVSTWIGQTIDSSIFVGLIFYHSPHVLNIFAGSVIFKIGISICMTPIVYAIVIGIHRMAGSNTLAFSAN